MIWWPYVLAIFMLGGTLGFFTCALMVMSKRSDEVEATEFSHGWQERRP